MKKNFLAGNRKFLAFWLVFHFVLLLFFLLTLAFSHGNLYLDADLFNMLPKPFAAESIKRADSKLTDFTAQNVFVLSKSENFGEAKEAAEKLYSLLKDSPKFKSLSLYADTSSFSEMTDFIFRYRWNLLGENDIHLIASPGGSEIFAQNAIASVFSPFSVFPLGDLDKDPFMLSETSFQRFLSSAQSAGTGMSVKDGVLASQKNGFWYVMLRGNLSKEGAALASKKNAVFEIKKLCASLEKPGVEFVFSGTPFHSYESSSSACREITVISVVSLTVVILILLLVFKSPTPILFSLFAIVVSGLTSLITTVSLFHKIHILTLVFGTSLIGSCIDYSLHFFINWKASRTLQTGSAIRSFLFSGLFFSLVSTEVCFAVLIFAPFNLLKQMSVFSLTGILSSFLTVSGIFPYIPLPKEEKREIKFLKYIRLPSYYNKKKAGRVAVSVLFVLVATLVLTNFNSLRVENNLDRLYTMKGHELEDEQEAMSVLNYSPSSWFIVSGETVEEVLEREEDLSDKIASSPEVSCNILRTSSFIPSIRSQKKSRAACEALLPLAESQLASLGGSPLDAENLRNAFFESKEDFIGIDKNTPDFLLDAVSAMWLGEINGKFYSVIIPSRLNESEAFFRSLAEEDDNVFFVNKMKDLSHDLDSLTSMILRFLIVAYIILFIVLKVFYKTKQVLKIVSIPLFVILTVSAVFGILKVHLEFFSITGMILVLGLGLDYIIYTVEGERRKEKSQSSKFERFAILLSFFTTAFSFGALSLSSFAPVHLMGLSILIGLITAYICSFFYDRS